MRGIVSIASYLPHWRLDKSAIGEVLGGSAGKGFRSVASYDEDSITLAVGAARRVMRSVADDVAPDSLWFATTSPTYLEKTHAPIAHAALRLSHDVLAADAGSGLRGAAAAMHAALRSTGAPSLVIAGDVRTGPAGSVEEKDGGDAGAAVLIGDDSASAPVIAEHVATGSATREFLDRWRVPGELRTQSWEERFGEQRYVELAEQAWNRALKSAALSDEQISAVAVSSPHARAANTFAKQLGPTGITVVDAWSGVVGFTGAAHPLLALSSLIEQAQPGQNIALMSLADGADVFIFKVTEAVSTYRLSMVTIADQIAQADDTLTYGKYLSWRGVLPIQPPNRPAPARMSASAAERGYDWKYGFVGSEDRETGALHLPPARVSFVGGNVDDMDPAPMADVHATVATFTIDSLAYSPSPPVVFAVCDFEGGGRLPVELTDLRPGDVSIGMTVEMTFRRLNTADGIANYFWKARPVSGVTDASTGGSADQPAGHTADQGDR